MTQTGKFIVLRYGVWDIWFKEHLLATMPLNHKNLSLIQTSFTV